MSRLVRLIDAYKDAHGQPSDSSVARAIGVKPQTLSSWRTRGIKEPPDRKALRKLAVLAGVDYETVVLRAALLDANWIDEERDGDDRTAAPMNEAARRGGLTREEREEAVAEGQRRRPQADEKTLTDDETA